MNNKRQYSKSCYAVSFPLSVALRRMEASGDDRINHGILAVGGRADRIQVEILKRHIRTDCPVINWRIFVLAAAWKQGGYGFG